MRFDILLYMKMLILTLISHILKLSFTRKNSSLLKVS